MSEVFWKSAFGAITEVTSNDFVAAALGDDSALLAKYALVKTVKAPTDRDLFGAARSVTQATAAAVLTESKNDYTSIPQAVSATVQRYAATVVALDELCVKMMDQFKAKGDDGLQSHAAAERALLDMQLEWLALSKLPTKVLSDELEARGATADDAVTVAFQIFQDKRNALPLEVSRPGKRERAVHAIETFDLAVDLRACSLTSNDARGFAEKIVATKAVATDVDIGSNLLYAEGAAALVTLVEGLPNLKVLRCGGNNIQLSGINRILTAVTAATEAGKSALETLDVSGSHGGPDAATALCAALPTTKLRAVGVSGNGIGGGQGSKDLANMLSMSERLTSLTTASNNMGDTGAKTIASGLKQNATLVSLDLRDNAITDVGAIELARAVAVHPTLSALDLSQNKISAAGISALADAAAENKGLFSVALDRQNVAAGAAFARAREESTLGSASLRSGSSSPTAGLENDAAFADAVTALTKVLAENKARFAQFTAVPPSAAKSNADADETLPELKSGQEDTADATNKGTAAARDAAVSHLMEEDVARDTEETEEEVNKFEAVTKSARQVAVEQWSLDDVLLWVQCAVRRSRAVECVAGRALDGAGLIQYSGISMRRDGLPEEDVHALLEQTAQLTL